VIHSQDHIAAQHTRAEWKPPELAKAPEWALSAMGAMMCGGSCLNAAVVVGKSMFDGSDVIAVPR
jgi:hypothetical protein